MTDEFAPAKFDVTFDDDERKCPYCGEGYQPDSEELSEDRRVEECDGCGKKYYAYDGFSTTFYAEPDCELNGEEHDWRMRSVGGARRHSFCAKCDKCMPLDAPESGAVGRVSGKG